MRFFSKLVVGLIALQASWVWADPLVTSQNDTDVLTSRGEDGLAKRNYPINLNFHSSVSAADQRLINQGFQDMQTLARAAANYNFQNTAGNVDGIYRRYFPQGSELKVQAMFRFLAGIPQTWGGVARNRPDFSGMTIKRSSAITTYQANTQQLGTGHTITFYDNAMPPKVPQSIQAMMPFRETKTSIKMEMLGAIILHELLHCKEPIVSKIMFFDRATGGSPHQVYIEDQPVNALGIPERAYGGYLAAKLKNQNAALAALNNDNFVYFALEAHWYPIVRPYGIFAPPDRECLLGCNQFWHNNCLWCWYR